MSASPEQIREAVDTVLSGRAYDLENPEVMRMDFGWIGAIINWLLEPLRRLFEGVGALPDGVTYVLIAVLVIILVALLAHVIYTAFAAFREDKFEVAAMDRVRPVTIDDLAAEAQRHADAGDFVDASRALYRAALLALEEKREGRLRKGLTNTEYLRTFHAPWVVENLRVFVDLINWKWYRDNRFEREDYEACREAYDNIQQRLREEFS